SPLFTRRTATVGEPIAKTATIATTRWTKAVGNDSKMAKARPRSIVGYVTKLGIRRQRMSVKTMPATKIARTTSSAARAVSVATAPFEDGPGGVCAPPGHVYSAVLVR